MTNCDSRFGHPRGNTPPGIWSYWPGRLPGGCRCHDPTVSAGKRKTRHARPDAQPRECQSSVRRPSAPCHVNDGTPAVHLSCTFRRPVIDYRGAAGPTPLGTSSPRYQGARAVAAGSGAPCRYSAGYLSNVTHAGPNVPPSRSPLSSMTCWTAAGNWSRSQSRGTRQQALPSRGTGTARTAPREPYKPGAVSLPQVPCRLVIEISSPDASTGRLVGDSDDREAIQRAARP
jgi:hypothetical protein